MVWPGAGASTAVAVPGVRLAPGDVLVRVELSTVCPIDVRMAQGGESAAPPLVLGHEAVGVIEAFGEGGARSSAGKKLSLGQRVVWAREVPCRHCAQCRRGDPGACVAAVRYGHERMRRGFELSGVFASHIHLRAGTAIVPVPRDAPAAVLAPANCTGALAIAALEATAETGPIAGAILVVDGADLLALTALAMAKDAGATVIARSTDAEARVRALNWGADAAAVPGAHPDSPLSLEWAIRGLARRSADHRVLALDEHGHALPRHLELAAGYLADSWHRHPFGAVVAEPLPLAQVDRAVALAATPDAPLRVAVTP